MTTTAYIERYALIAAKMFAKATAHPDKVERIAKGLALLVNGHVSMPAQTRSGTMQWVVASQSCETLYRVTKNPTTPVWICTCKDYEHNGTGCCKHVAAAYITDKAATHYTHTDATGATVLLGHKATADAQRAIDAATPLWKQACDRQHR